MFPLCIREAIEQTDSKRNDAMLSWLEKHRDAEVLAWTLYQCRQFGPSGAKYFDTNAPSPFVIREAGILLSGKDVGRWDTDPAEGEFAITLGGTDYFRVPLAAMPSHAGPIWQRRVALPILPHLVLLPDEPYAVEIEWKDAPPVAPMVFLDGWLFRTI